MRALLAAIAISLGSTAAADPTAAKRLNEPGPEAQQLASEAGTWEVTATMWPAPDAKPIVTKNLVAERTMIGGYLQETMKPAAGAKDPPFTRIDYVYYSRVEGRWQYVSMDTRMPVGVMPAASFDRGTDKALTFEFAPLGFVGMGDKVEGTLMRSDMVITRDGKDHQVKEQHWVKADGTGKAWLAIRYDYRRKS